MKVFTMLAGRWLLCLESINSQITTAGGSMSWAKSLYGTYSQRQVDIYYCRVRSEDVARASSTCSAMPTALGFVATAMVNCNTSGGPKLRVVLMSLYLLDRETLWPQPRLLAPMTPVTSEAASVLYWWAQISGFQKLRTKRHFLKNHKES